MANFFDIPARPEADADVAVAIGRVAVFETIADALPDWSRLEAAPGGSAYQSRAFALAWLRHLDDGAAPLIVVGYDSADRPAALLPLALVRRGPVRLAVFAGARHSNLNLPLCRPGVCATPQSARSLLQAAARLARRPPDLFLLLNQPRLWNGAPNGFALIDPHAAPSNAYGAVIGADAKGFLERAQSKAARKKLRAKAGKLAEIGVVRVERATDADRARTILSTFIEQKTQRFAGKGKDAGVTGLAARAFYDALATDAAHGGPALDLYALSVDGRIAATYGGLARQGRWHGLFNSIATSPDIARYSPGDLLLRELILDLGARGIEAFDLGVGEARYKAAICDETIELADVALPVTMLGRIWAPVEIARRDLKRRVKQTPWALSFVERMRAGQA